MLEGLVKLGGRTNGRIVVVGDNVTVDTGGNTVGVVVDVSVVPVDVFVVLSVVVFVVGPAVVLVLVLVEVSGGNDVGSSAICYGYTPDKVL
jgi:hypothetical protein